MNQLHTILFVCFVLFSVILYTTMEPYGSVILRQPSQFVGGSQGIGNLITLYQNSRGVFTRLPLNQVLSQINANENFVLSSTDNDIGNRKGLENPTAIIADIIPYVQPILNNKGLKIAINPFNDEYIMRPFADKDEAYPTGYWLSVVDSSSVY